MVRVRCLRSFAGHLRVTHQPEPTVWQAEAKVGGQGRNRTSDTVIFSHVLYQLSYLASVSMLRSRAEIRV